MRQKRICVVGPGTRFLSGVSYYTLRLANALSESHEVSAILMRRLLPTRLYPGRERVGKAITQLRFARSVRVFDGVDWFWWPSLFAAIGFLIRQRPDVLVLQWWSGTVLHSYLALGLVARMVGTRVLVEFHERLDTAEERLPFVRTYVRLVAPLLLGLACAFVVHSEYDRARLRQHYHLRRPVTLISHGPFDHYVPSGNGSNGRVAPAAVCNFLYFGVIRPFKGVEDLIRAFDCIPEADINSYWLTVVGETWEGWTLPRDLILASRYRHRITFVNRYVDDKEVADYFAGADVVALPYRRSSASGPLQIAMSRGLPIVVTAVGGLPEAVAGYAGAMLVPPDDLNALNKALVEAARRRGRRFLDPHSWDSTVQRYEALCTSLAVKPRTLRGSA